MFRRIRKAFTNLFKRGKKEKFNIGIDQPAQVNGKPDAPVQELEKEFPVPPALEKQNTVKSQEPKDSKHASECNIKNPCMSSTHFSISRKREQLEHERVEIEKPENEKEQEKVEIVKPENEDAKPENEKKEHEKAVIKEPEKCEASAFAKASEELDRQRFNRYIEDYDLCSFLGEGGFGKVYLAKHKPTGAMVAIKTLQKQGITDKSSVKRIVQEKNILELAKRNQNPFLVGLFASFRTTHHVCLVTDYCAGGDLSTYLKNRMPQERVVFYSGCVILGLQFLHKHKIIHRDIKPENILVDSDGYAKITDYGLAKKTFIYGAKTWNIGGTCYYMAPEMIKGMGYTKSVDWWALGIMIYEMLTNKHPFNGKTIKKLDHSITHDQLQFPNKMSEDSIEIIERLLNKNPEMRLGSTYEDAEDVKKCSFYKDMDFDALAKKQIEPPYIPKEKTQGCFRRMLCKRKNEIILTEEGCRKPWNSFPHDFKDFECSLFLPSNV